MRLLEKSGIEFDSFAHPATDEGKAAKRYQQVIEQRGSHEDAEREAPWPTPRLKEFPDFVKERERKGWSPRERISISSSKLGA
jgi:hypothetical protein